jgi:hypothetical protein
LIWPIKAFGSEYCELIDFLLFWITPEIKLIEFWKRSLNQNPGSLAFSRDKLLDIPFIADFVALKANRQLQIDKRLLRTNASCCPHDFSVGENIYVQNGQMKSKLQPPWEGPFPIICVQTNGTVTFHHPNLIEEQHNIRQIKPA